MAFTPIAVADIASDKPITTDLLMTIKNNLDDLDSRITGLITVTVSNSGTLSDTPGDYFIEGDTSTGNITSVLPDPAVMYQHKLVFKKISTDSNTWTIDASPSTIDGSSTKTIDNPYESFTIISNGSAWYTSESVSTTIESIIPSINNTYTLGNSSYQWSSLHSQKVTVDNNLTIETTNNNGDILLQPHGTGIVSSTKDISSAGKFIGRGIVPLGGIIPIYNYNLTGTIAIPVSGSVSSDGWIRCDGLPIPSGNIVAGTTPNLSDSRFIRGATTSGITGGENTRDFSHTHTLSHTHGTDSQLGTITLAHSHTVNDHAHTIPAHYHYMSLSTSGQSANHVHVFTTYSGGYHTHFVPAAQTAGVPHGSLDCSVPSDNGVSYSVDVTIPSNGSNHQHNGVTEGVSADHGHTVSGHVGNTGGTSGDTDFASRGSAPGTNSQLSNYNGSHSHSTNSQSSSITSPTLSSSFDIQPRYVNCIYLMRVN
jgi:hypothetical protein